MKQIMLGSGKGSYEELKKIAIDKDECKNQFTDQKKKNSIFLLLARASVNAPIIQLCTFFKKRSRWRSYSIINKGRNVRFLYPPAKQKNKTSFYK